jgi:hypothetical protein
VGRGWRLLEKGERLEPGDGFMHPDQPGMWIDHACRPDLFTGGGSKGTYYFCPKDDTAHTFPWRRKEKPKPAPAAKGKRGRGK